MKMTFRWYGDSDPVPLDYIRQIPGVEGVVSAVGFDRVDMAMPPACIGDPLAGVGSDMGGKLVGRDGDLRARPDLRRHVVTGGVAEGMAAANRRARLA